MLLCYQCPLQCTFMQRNYDAVDVHLTSAHLESMSAIVQENFVNNLGVSGCV